MVVWFESLKIDWTSGPFLFECENVSSDGVWIMVSPPTSSFPPSKWLSNTTVAVTMMMTTFFFDF
jgi:hypothetical protein